MIESEEEEKSKKGDEAKLPLVQSNTHQSPPS